MKRFPLIFVILLFVSCGFNSDVETTFAYNWKKQSFIDGYILKMRDDMSFEDGKIKTYLDSEKGNGAMPNLSIGNLGAKSTAYGIDIDRLILE